MRGALIFLSLLATPASAHDISPDIETLIAKDACTDLLLTYGEGLDEREPTKIWPLFTQDAVWIADGTVLADSRAALRELWEGLAANPRPTVGVHAISNIHFARMDDDALAGTALVVMYRYNPQERDAIVSLSPMLLVEISMRCVRTEEGWRFARMELQSVSVADYAHGEG